MKKNFITAILLGASMLSFSAFAQAPKCDADCPKTECSKEKCVVPAGPLKNFNPFIGTTITPEQQAKIDALNKQRQEKMSAAREHSRQSRQMNDSVRRADKLDYFHQIRDIIGPDQYVIFLENIAVAQPQSRGVAPARDGAIRAKMDKGDKSKGNRDMKSAEHRHHAWHYDKK